LNTSSSKHTDLNSGSIPCAVIYAGAEVVLAIVERPGRSPVSLSFTRDPIIAWRSADGVDEFIELQGTHGSVDFQALMSQIESGGLLVAEVTEMSGDNLESANYWTIGGVKSKENEAPSDSN